jgi:hypothetical protein
MFRTRPCARSIAAAFSFPLSHLTALAGLTLGSLAAPLAQAQTAPFTTSPPAAMFSGPGPCLPSGLGLDYHVGPGQAYPTLESVPWESLGAGDTVRIEYNNGVPYTGKMFISAQGTAAAPVRVCGIRGPAGQRPEIDGRNAVTRSTLQNEYGNTYFDPTLGVTTQDLMQARGIIMINYRYATQSWGVDVPKYIQIDGLALRHAHPSYTFTNALGQKLAYRDFSAGIWIHRGQNITVADNEISDCVMGVFSRSVDSPGNVEVTSNIRLSGNYFWGHGIVGQDLQHSTYTESVGLVSEFNRYGPLRAGALGHSIKDRSVGTVVRYNLIEGGGHAIDLVEAEDFPLTATANPAYRSTFVYGNLIVRNGSLGSAIHYGGDHFGSAAGLTWGEPIFRQGTLYFYNNSMHVTGLAGSKSWLFQLSTTLETAEVFNNVFAYDATVSGGKAMRMPQSQGVAAPWVSDGVVNLGRNWTNTGWVDYFNPINGALNGTANLISAATAPVTLTTMVPTAGGKLIDASITLPAAVSAHPVLYQIDVNGQRSVRTMQGTAMDLGALEATGPATAAPAATPATTPAAAPAAPATTAPAAPAAPAATAPATTATTALTQKITIKTPTKITIKTAPTATITAAASSGLTVMLTASPATVCSVSGVIVTGIKAGTCTITANQAGNVNWKAAAAVSKKITVK